MNTHDEIARTLHALLAELEGLMSTTPKEDQVLLSTRTPTMLLEDARTFCQQLSTAESASSAAGLIQKYTVHAELFLRLARHVVETYSAHRDLTRCEWPVGYSRRYEQLCSLVFICVVEIERGAPNPFSKS